MRMKDYNEVAIWSTVGLGLALYVATFVVVWNATADYRENIARPMLSQSETVRNSLHTQ